MTDTLTSPRVLTNLENVSREHPRVLGSRDRLRQLAKQRPEAYKRMCDFAMRPFEDEYWAVHGKIIGLSIKHAVEGDPKIGREVVDIVLREYIDAPIETGHVAFGTSMARCGFAYDLCNEHWTADEKQRLFDYMQATIEANPEEEPSVFHNGWYGYKNWGYGVAAYATLFDNPRAETILRNLEEEYLRRAVPALKVAGDGGGWAEGFYIHYWIHEWLFFTEVARLCGGVDYYATAPEFYSNRAIAGMFENYPTIADGTRRPIPMGDGMGRKVNNERDKELAARRILVNYYREDPAHQAVHAYNELTPLMHFDHNSYRDFLWNDRTVKKGDLKNFRLSHFSPGAGFVYARSSWDEDATFLFFHCGRRFTSHQHLDNNHFVLWKNTELLGDGGHYDAFDTDHCVNFYMRTIAHNSILVKDPSEQWPKHTPQTPKGMRAGPDGVNDGGQAYPWPAAGWGHNGGAWDLQMWLKSPHLGEIGSMLAFEDKGTHVYMAGDATRSYSAKKLELFTRQILYVRPGTVIVFDRVKSTDPDFRKTLLLHPMKVPTGDGRNMTMTNGNGRLFIQTLLPEQSQVKLFHGSELWKYDGVDHPPTRDTGPGPECRVEVSPDKPAKTDYFLQILTATDASVSSVPQGSAKVEGNEVVVTLADKTIRFTTDRVGGSISIGGKATELGGKLAPLPIPELT